jgi:hypothetical protein
MSWFLAVRTRSGGSDQYPKNLTPGGVAALVGLGWDMSDADGRRVAPRICLARVRSDACTVMRRVIVMP